jgi:hypothetical protein
MSGFHGSESDGDYSRVLGAATGAATALVVGSILSTAVLLVALARPGLRGAGLALSGATLAPAIGCVLAELESLALLGVGAVSTGLVVTLGTAAVGVSGGSALGFLALGLSLLGAGMSGAVGRLGAPAVGPLLVAGLVAASTVSPHLLATEEAGGRSTELGCRLFLVDPLASASRAVSFDLLRNDYLYGISTLGSSLPLGYPSPWTHGAVAGLAGLALIGLTRVRRTR